MAMLVLLAAGGARAANPVLGQPLDYQVLVRSDGIEAFAADCVAAEVSLGDRRLPPAAVRVQLEPMAPDVARVRVRTTVVVDEPVLTLRLSTGCVQKVARQYVLLADMPAAAQALAPAAAAVVAPAIPPAVAAAPSSTPEVSATSGVPATSPVAAAAAAPAATVQRPRAQRADSRPAARAAAGPRRPAVTARAPVDPAPRLKLEAAGATGAAPAAPREEAAAVEQALAAVAQAAQAAREAASAASAAGARIAALEADVERLRADKRRDAEASAALRSELASSRQRSRWFTPLLWASLGLVLVSAGVGWHLGGVHKRRQQDWQRMAFGGATVSRLQREAQAAAVGGAAGAAAQGPTSSSSATPAPMPTRPVAGASRFDRDAGVSGFGTGPGSARVSGFGESRSFGPTTIPGSVQHAPPPGARPATRSAANPTPMDSAFGRAPTAPIPLVTQELPVRPVATSTPGAARTEAASERTEVLPASLRLPEAEASSRDVSIEELIDLEQQADFFVVLGQDDAAIELLVEHLRATGGGSPLPYLKLLEIHRRREEQAAYERIRSRFNQRFNAYAPEWGSDLAAGRALESYPGVVPRLQQVWARPLDAMAELEALLFRKSRGDLFELPAYREVLFLYALARDLLDREAASTGNVDLLLPLADGGEFGPTTPRPYFGLEDEGRSDSSFGPGDPRDGADSVPPNTDFGDLAGRPTAPLDLEIGGPAAGDRRSSIFDPFDDRPAPSRG